MTTPDTVRGVPREQWIARGTRSVDEWMAADHWLNPLLKVVAGTFGRYVESTPARRLAMTCGDTRLRSVLDREANTLGLPRQRR